MRDLPDVNVLVALADVDHEHHPAAISWVDSMGPGGWASCAITENGLVRIMSQPAYTNSIAPATAIGILDATCRGTDHEYWPCDVSLRDSAAVARREVRGPKQVTDTYLLALATRHGGRLVTFDRAISLATVPGATEANLVVL